MISIERPASTADLDEVRALMRAFVGWHRARHAQDAELIDGYFDPEAFEEELAGLPGRFAPPDGDLLLARWEGEAAGCVALRRLDDRTCEMKRMFLYPRFHGRGLGYALGQTLLVEAKTAGYELMRLDTSVRQEEAQALYRKLGFRRIDAYYDVPAPLGAWLVFMEREL